MYDVCSHHVTFQVISAILLSHQAMTQQYLQVSLAKFRSISAVCSVLSRILHCFLLVLMCMSVFIPVTGKNNYGTLVIMVNRQAS